MDSPGALVQEVHVGSTLVEALDRVLNTGVVLGGDIAISVADIELIYLRLQLVLTSVETAREAGWLLQVAPLPVSNPCDSPA